MIEINLFQLMIVNLLGYRFFQFAILGGTIAALTCSLIGLFVILRRESMISDGVAHASFGGIALGLFLGINPILTALIISIVSVIIISYMRRKGLAQSDSAIAVILAVGFSSGLVIISLAGGFNVELFSFLFGSILTIDQFDLLFISILSLFVIIFVGIFYKELLSITFDEEASKLMGIPVLFISTIFDVLVAITIVLSIKVVGMILVTALFVLPGLTALQLKLSFKKTVFTSIFFGTSSLLVGVFLSALYNIATSGIIVFTSVGLFLFIIIYKKLG